jgi:hypothetical protein
MLPPSSGRIGTRLNSPMIGPAHQIANRSAGSEYDGRSSRAGPEGERIATLTATWMPGPANEMPICSALDSGRVGT